MSTSSAFTTPRFHTRPVLTPSQTDIQVELEILVACLLDNQNGYKRIYETITPPMFVTKQHQLIVEAIGQTPPPYDLLNLAIALTDSGKLQRVGGQAALTRTMEVCVHAQNLENHAALLEKAHPRRQAARITAEIEQAIANSDISRAASLGESLSDLSIGAITPEGKFISEVDRLIDRSLVKASMKATTATIAGQFRQSVGYIDEGLHLAYLARPPGSVGMSIF